MRRAAPRGPSAAGDSGRTRGRTPDRRTRRIPHRGTPGPAGRPGCSSGSRRHAPARAWFEQFVQKGLATAFQGKHAPVRPRADTVRAGWRGNSRRWRKRAATSARRAVASWMRGELAADVGGERRVGASGGSSAFHSGQARQVLHGEAALVVAREHPGRGAGHDGVRRLEPAPLVAVALDRRLPDLRHAQARQRALHTAAIGPPRRSTRQMSEDTPPASASQPATSPGAARRCLRRNASTGQGARRSIFQLPPSRR